VPASKTAFVFPAFVNEYSEALFNAPGIEDTFRRLLGEAASLFDPDLAYFSTKECNFPGDELRTQLITYILSCSISYELRKNQVIPSISAGYSMGIYAAAFDAGSIDFAGGLFLIREAYILARKACSANKWGMCGVLGLGREDLDDLLKMFPSVRITNQNSPHSFILSGEAGEVNLFIDAAREEGALNTVLLNTGLPYHSPVLNVTEREFSRIIKGQLQVRTPSYPIISLVDRSMLVGSSAIINEFVRNLYTPLNWYMTLQKILESGIRTIIECGPGKGLVKNAKFVEGEFEFITAESKLARG
jgi:[acyl-carrier-protein] S-malonyltransferase